MSANDMQVGGDHYKSKAIQAWDYIVSNGLGFFEGNIVKYITRYKDKGGIDDLRKARHYLDKLIEIKNSSEQKVNACFGSEWKPVILAGEAEAPAHKDTANSQDCAKDAPTELQVGWVYKDDDGDSIHIYYELPDHSYAGTFIEDLDNLNTNTYLRNGEMHNSSRGRLDLLSGATLEQHFEKENNND